MKRVFSRLWLFLCLCSLCLFALPSAAAASYGEAFDAEEVAKEVPRSAREAVKGLDVSGGDNAALEKGLGNLLRMAGRLFPGSVGAELRTLLALFITAGICCAIGSFTDEIPVAYVTTAGVLFTAGITLTGFGGLLDNAQQVMTELSLYSKTLLSTMTALTAASGAPATAAVTASITILFSDLLATLYERLLIPLLYIYAALLTANAALSRPILERLAALVKWFFGGVLTLTLMAFTAYLTISGAIRGQADQMAVRGARAALSGIVPMVGGIIADASEAVLSGVGLIRSAVGVFGVVAVLGIVLTPIITIAVRYCMFKLGGALIGTVGDNALGGYVNSLAGLFMMMLAVVCASGFLVLCSVISLLQAGGI